MPTISLGWRPENRLLASCRNCKVICLNFTKRSVSSLRQMSSPTGRRDEASCVVGSDTRYLSNAISLPKTGQRRQRRVRFPTKSFRRHPKDGTIFPGDEIDSSPNEVMSQHLEKILAHAERQLVS